MNYCWTIETDAEMCQRITCVVVVVEASAADLTEAGHNGGGGGVDLWLLICLVVIDGDVYGDVCG